MMDTETIEIPLKSKVPLTTHASSALSLYAENFLLFISFPMLQVLLLIGYVIIGIAVKDFKSMPGIAWNIVGTFSYYYFCLCLIYVVMQRVSGVETTLKAAMVSIGTRWYPLFIWYVLYRMKLDEFLFSRLAIPVLYVAVVTTFMPYAAVGDGLGFKDSLVRSYDLVKGRFWRVAFANLLPLSILWWPTVLGRLLPGSGLSRTAYIVAVQVFVLFLSPLIVAFYAYLYSEYKAVREREGERPKSSSKLNKLLAPLVPDFVTRNVEGFKYGMRLDGMSSDERSVELVSAAFYGRLDIIKMLVKNFGQPVDMTANDISAVQAAAENGHLDVIKWLVEESGQSVDVTANDNGALAIAAMNGHLNVVKWLVLESGQTVDVTANDNAAVCNATYNGHLNVVKWLVKESGQVVDVTSGDNLAVRWAAWNGHLDVVKWLVEESGQSVDATAADNSAVFLAAWNGHLDVVKWLVEESGQSVNLTANDNCALSEAAGNGHLDVVKWLVKDSIQSVDVTAGDNNAVQCAAGNGHLDVVKWLVEESGQLVDVTVDDNWSVRGAAQKGHLDVIKWLVEKSGRAIDCSNCSTWDVKITDENGNDILVCFDEWPQESKDYLLGIKALQDAE